jgi:N-acetylglucosaminyl-diphospho-decaprenol L-rhamnosyltransferase
VTPTVEVLVVSYGSARVVARLLASLATHLPDAPVAIREHAGSPHDAAALEQLAAGHSAPVRVEHDPSNPGFGAGCNALAASSTADFLLFLNPDTELVSWPWNATSPPPAGTVVGPLMVDSGPPGEHYGRRYRIRDEVARSWLRRQPQRPDGSGYVSGAALLVERAAFGQIGGFDEGFFLFYEDIDLCLRANAAGYPTLIDDRWTVRHGRHHSTSERFAQSLVWSYQSALRFHAKHGSPAWAYRGYVATDSLLRAVYHSVRRHRTEGGAYAALARRALIR